MQHPFEKERFQHLFFQSGKLYTTLMNSEIYCGCIAWEISKYDIVQLRHSEAETQAPFVFLYLLASLPCQLKDMRDIHDS